MNITYKINGETVTAEEKDACIQRRVDLFGSGIEESVAYGSNLDLDTDTALAAKLRMPIEEMFPREEQREAFVKAAKAAGHPDDVRYDPTLARKRNDPRAMFSSDGIKMAILSQADTFKYPNHAPPREPCKLHPRLIEEERQARLTQDPGLAEKDQRELVEQIVEEHGAR